MHFGDILLSELDCIPANVTKNASRRRVWKHTQRRASLHKPRQVDKAWIANALDTAETTALTVATQRTKEQKRKAKLRELYNANGASKGENISEFINTCDAVGEMVREGLLTRGRGNEYKWHGSQSDRSCEIFDDGVIHIFSATMQTFSPAPETEPVNAHRFYLYQLSGLDLAKESEQAKCREYLFDRGYGSDPKAYTKAKLKRTPPAEIPEPVNAPAETLAENRDSREQATDAFFTSEPDTPERLKVLLIRDDTGTGKSHTILTKAGQYGKRTLAQYTHTELATQAVETVWEFGYKNPCHLKGRAHNWDEAGIAEIPVNMRTADLFEKNNCIMFDCVQEYTDNRLAPRTYCEHKCPFKDDCLHLAQYQGLGDRDFIATCAPDVLFDLKFRGYLNSLVTATSEPTDDELAIDAAWGTESEATENFDFAIVDDYGISALYPDVVFTEKEFKALKTAWKGKPTADFAKQVLKAFEKKKPHKIVKALRNALESTSEHHTEIAEALTQHARIGVIEAYEKRAIETAHLPADQQGVYAKARVRYDDGGMQFIPNVEYTPTHTQVMKLAKQLPSAETKPFTEAMYIGKRTYTDTRLENIRKHYAYKVLKSKEIPVINPNRLDTDNVGDRVCIPHAPVHALIAGVSVSDLTPVWQSGATPIELLQIFLTSLGADKNAPIHRTFRVSTEQPNAVLTFSIPPQAPVGILPQIAMLSATTDTEAVKEAFTGQAVDFSEHIGGQVELADGVQIYQFADARLTSASVFEYPKDTKGKRKLQETPTALTPTAENRLVKLNNWAKAIDGVTAFISYKEFTDDPFNDAVNGFDIVTHFDRVAGLNFDGLKFLVVFGYPKVNHDVVMNQARVQYARDTQPLPKGTYDDLTQDTPFTERGYTITERRYKDPRLEKIRHQLATEKLNQAVGRARLPVWTDTDTLIFTDAPIERITERATLFSSHAFNLAETPDGLSDAMHRIEKAEATGDVKTVMETKGVSERTARLPDESNT